MNRVIIGIGSNTADRAERMKAALDYVFSSFQNVRVSTVYETPEWSGRYAPYFNCVAEGTTAMALDEVIDRFKKYEISCGRTPDSKLTGSVPIDIDVVVWNGEVVRPVDMEREYFSRGYNQLNGSSR